MARILIVEDSPDNMKLFRAVLEHRGHQVIGIEDGGHLRDALEASDPEVILMDIQLPGLDGFELLRTVRSSLKSKVPVVALTAHAMVGDQDRAEAAGFNAYITKPIDVIKFPSQVEEVLNRNPGPGFA